MANAVLKCQRSACGHSSLKTLETVYRTIAGPSKNYSSNNDRHCKGPYGADSRDTEDECEHFKRMMGGQSVERTCIRDNTKACRNQACTNSEKEECAIPEEVFNRCEEKTSLYKSICEIVQMKMCLAKNRPQLCKMEKPICYSRQKVYPMRHAGLKPEIDGRPITGESWRKKSWGFKKC